VTSAFPRQLETPKLSVASFQTKDVHKGTSKRSLSAPFNYKIPSKLFDQSQTPISSLRHISFPETTTPLKTHFAKMSSPTHSFLTLIPATHRVASISPFTSPVDGTAEESLVPALQKNRRSSSTTSAESNSTTEEPVVDSPVDAAKTPQVKQVATHRFLRLGN